MNILITAPSLDPTTNVSGVSTVVQTIIQHNPHHRYHHYLLGRPDKKLNKVNWLFQLIKQVILFPAALKKNNIDLVHQNLPFDPKGVSREFIINCWCRLFKIPVVLHVHGGIFLMNGTNNPIFRIASKALFKYSEQVIVLSEIEQEALKEQYQFATAKVLYNSIDTELYITSHKRLSSAKPKLLFLGRIHESKGINDIAEALQLLKKNIDFQFILCGAGPLKDELEETCQKLLGDDFEYKGVISGEAKITILKQADFFLLPSRYGEGLPMALLEAMAAGAVPIVTDDASMKFVVQHEFNGIRVNKKDPQDLYEKILHIIKNRDLYTNLSENAILTVKRKYNISNYIHQLNEIYTLIKYE